MKIKTWHVIALISSVVLVAYYPALSAPFNSVDDARLVNQLMNRTDFSWRELVIPGAGSYYRPLINSSFILDRILWGMSAPLMHLENVCLHLFNTLLLFGLARQMCRALALHGLGLPTIAALVFGLHPINVEAVAWVAGRADLLVGTFVLLTLNAFWRGLVTGKTFWLLLAAGSFFLGCLSKETALFLLPGLFLISWMRTGPVDSRVRPFCDSLIKPVCLMIPFGVATGAYFMLRSWALRGRDLGLKHVARLASDPESSSAAQAVAVPQGTQSSVLEPLLLKVEQLVTIAGFYAKKLFWPFPLNFGIVEVPDGYLWVGILLLFCALLLLWRRTLAGSLSLTAMSLASIALLVAFGGISWTPVAERYMYVPAAVLSLGCTLGGGRLYYRPCRLWLQGLIMCLLLVFFVGTFKRSLVWQDNVSLFADTVKKSPGFAMAKNELAMALLARGEKKQAFEILRDLELPDFQVASLNRIMVLADEGHLAEARALLLERLQNPQTYETIIQLKLVVVLENMVNRATTEQQARVHQEEIIVYLRKIWTKSRDPFYLYRMGQFQMATGDRDSARESFAQAAELLPEGSPYKEPSRKLALSLK